MDRKFFYFIILQWLLHLPYLLLEILSIDKNTPI